MIRVAYGEKLPLSQADVGHQRLAMECRINAEDPFRGFMLPPVYGHQVQRPRNQMARCGSIRRLTTAGISMFYDSMIAKLIVHGTTREQAISRMRDALNGFVIRGISSNIPFQAALMQHPRFQSGNFNTGFIAEEYPKGFDASMVPHDDPALLVSVAAYVYRAFTDRSASISGQLQGHERIVSDQWCVVRLNPSGNENHMVVARPIRGGYHVEYQGEKYESCPTGSSANRCSTAPATARNLRCRSSGTRRNTPCSIGVRAPTSW